MREILQTSHHCGQVAWPLDHLWFIHSEPAETKLDPVGLLGTEALLCPFNFLIIGNKLHSGPMTFPGFQWTGSDNSC